MSGTKPDPRPNRTPEEEAAGNRRALIGCGIPLVLLLVGFIWVIYAMRMSAGGQGEVCERKSDCKPGHECVGDAFKAVKPVCRKSCDKHDDCPKGRCEELLRGRGKVCQ
ncbi:uncharacterized protein CMC5_047370 [Chondromyces crocatus]|uniref:Uncharacterized protein n=1 Tax=Chondromyces crocatus TaxID=52 RepID=A0A0K1EI97_CHOCO|nr:uncharacterized protein CMC5_047370 [Chondromyces crocatus]